MEETNKNIPEATNFIEQFINEDMENGKVTSIQTRFPPEPNGYLHIGHAKSMYVNFGTALKYHGKCNLFFDDTNPSKEKTEFVDAIRADIVGWVMNGRASAMPLTFSIPFMSLRCV